MQLTEGKAVIASETSRLLSAILMASQWGQISCPYVPAMLKIQVTTGNNTLGTCRARFHCCLFGNNQRPNSALKHTLPTPCTPVSIRACSPVLSQQLPHLWRLKVCFCSPMQLTEEKAVMANETSRKRLSAILMASQWVQISCPYVPATARVIWLCTCVRRTGHTAELIVCASVLNMVLLCYV